MLDSSLIIDLHSGGLHLDWCDIWHEPISDIRLKQSIFSDERHMSHILPTISRFNGKWEPEERSEGKYEALMAEYSIEESLFDLGLAWCAPQLHLNLLDKALRYSCGELSSSQIATVRKYRDHCKPDELNDLPKEFVVPFEGRKCVLSWLSTQTSLNAEQTMYRLPKADFSSLDRVNLRSRLFTSYLANINEQARYND